MKVYDFTIQPVRDPLLIKMDRKISPQSKAIIGVIIIICAIVGWFFYLGIKASDNSNASLCASWNKADNLWRNRGYYIAHTTDEITLCQNSGVTLTN